MWKTLLRSYTMTYIIYKIVFISSGAHGTTLKSRHCGLLNQSILANCE